MIGDEDGGSHSMSWHGLYSKKQVEQMKGEKQNGF
jgi:hypothetical protein